MEYIQRKILHEVFRAVSRFPRYSSCYIAENRLSLGQCKSSWLDFEQSFLGSNPGTESHQTIFLTDQTYIGNW